MHPFPPRFFLLSLPHNEGEIVNREIFPCNGLDNIRPSEWGLTNSVFIFTGSDRVSEGERIPILAFSRENISILFSQRAQGRSVREQ